jgi:uncharacterized membrane protein YkvA (DUF1232 family)
MQCLSTPITCLLLAGAIIYVISPIDLVPEMIFGPIGLIDDAMVIIGSIFMLTKGGLSNIFGFLK